jgi:hypothetical protein
LIYIKLYPAFPGHQKIAALFAVFPFYPDLAFAEQMNRYLVQI